MKININSVGAVAGKTLDSLRPSLKQPVPQVAGVAARIGAVLESPAKIINRMKREQAKLIAPLTNELNLKCRNVYTHNPKNIHQKPKADFQKSAKTKTIGEAPNTHKPGYTKEILRKSAQNATLGKIKPKRLVGNFYKLLRGTPLNVCNIRVPGFTSQEFCDLPKEGSRTIAVIEGPYGVTVSDLPCVSGSTAKLDAKRGFDLFQIKGIKTWSVSGAAAHFKKAGKQHTVRIQKKEITGWTLGKITDPYVAFYDGKAFRTIESRLVSGKNLANHFTLIK